MKRGGDVYWNIVYRYNVNGRFLESSGLHFGTAQTTADVISMGDRFPLGMEVWVSYHPDKPEVSVLIPGANRYTYSALFIGPLILWIGAATFGFFIF